MSDFFKTHFSQFGQEYVQSKISPPNCKCGFPCIISENLDNFYDSNYTCEGINSYGNTCDFCKPIKDHSGITKMFYNELSYSLIDRDYAESKQCSLTKINRNVELEMKTCEDAKNDTIRSFHDIYMNKINELEEEVRRLRKNKHTKPPKQWDKFDVVDWVNQIGEIYKQYNKTLLHNNITGEVLLHTTFNIDDLYRVGISNETHRKRIMHELSKLYSPDDICDY